MHRCMGGWIIVGGQMDRWVGWWMGLSGWMDGHHWTGRMDRQYRLSNPSLRFIVSSSISFIFLSLHVLFILSFSKQTFFRLSHQVEATELQRRAFLIICNVYTNDNATHRMAKNGNVLQRETPCTHLATSRPP